MSLPEFFALLERHSIGIERHEFMLAQMTAVLLNHVSWKKFKRDFTPEDFMPSRVSKKRQEQPKKRDPLEVINRLDAFAARNPGLPRAI